MRLPINRKLVAAVVLLLALILGLSTATAALRKNVLPAPKIVSDAYRQITYKHHTALLLENIKFSHVRNYSLRVLCVTAKRRVCPTRSHKNIATVPKHGTMTLKHIDDVLQNGTIFELTVTKKRHIGRYLAFELYFKRHHWSVKGPFTGCLKSLRSPISCTTTPAHGTTTTSTGTTTGTTTTGTTTPVTTTPVYAAPPASTPSYTVTVTKSGTSGTISGSGISCGSTCTVTATDGTVIQLTETPPDGSSFSGWGGACTGTGSTCSFVLSANSTVTAKFSQIYYTLSVSVSGSGTASGSGISCPGTCSSSYAAGTAVPLSASPGSSYSFGGWGGACSGTGGCTVTMNGNESVSATFNYVAPPPSPPSPSVSVGFSLSGGEYHIETTTANFSGNVSCSITEDSKYGLAGYVSWTQGANATTDSAGDWTSAGTTIQVTCDGVSGSAST